MNSTIINSTSRNSSSPTIVQSLGFYARIANRLNYLLDFHCYHTSYINSSSSINETIHYPLFYVLSYKNCSPSYIYFFLFVIVNSEPKKILQASKHE